MKKDLGEILLTIIGAIVLVFIVMLVLPFCNFWIAYFGGWIAILTIGVKLVAKKKMIYNKDYFKADMLPMMAGALGWIGSYFKTYSSNSNKNK